MGKKISIQELYVRDNGICGICKKPVTKRQLTKGLANRDHIIPASDGGSNRSDNLRLAHYECNIRRGNEKPSKTMQEWLSELGQETDWTCPLCDDKVENDWSVSSIMARIKRVAHRKCLENRGRARIKTEVQ
jgi:hypothetical protein